VIYYAGHGIEVDGTNYLIPVDARLERDTDIYDEAFSLDRILVAVEPAKQLRLVILDACRDNPFARAMKRSIASRSVGRGLAKIEPMSPNTLIAYSAKAGSTAQDGFVRDDVLKSTGNRQEPFVYGSLGGNDVALVPQRDAPAQPAPNSQVEIRHDYELALQVGNKAAMNAFIAQHPDGFYTSLAKLQLEKIAAEEAHAAATEKARLAEQERARLAAEGAKKEAQAKAEADAKAAEEARLSAEKAKQATQAQAQAAEAERQRAEKITSNPIVASNEAGDLPAPPAQATAPEQRTNVASLSEGSSQPDLTKSVQSELRRVGCLKADADGNWNATSQRSLTQFNRYANTKLDTKLASSDALDAIKQKPSRVCPLACEHGYQAEGDSCVKITCAEGSFLNDDNQCQKRREKSRERKAVATRDRPEARQALQPRQVEPRQVEPRPVEPRQVIVRRYQPHNPSTAASGRPLTGDERQWGCNSHEAIMSGKCP
jgi:hypothetical protein